MKIETSRVRECLKSFDFPTLFREHLGWDSCQSRVDVTVDGNTLQLTAIAQKRGFVALTCPSIPNRATRLKVDHQVSKSFREHFVVYADKSAGVQVWQWVRREPGKPMASRDHRFHASQSGDPLIQRLEQIAVSMEEEESLTLMDVTSHARAAFDVDKVTKKFYDRFQDEHAAFLKLVQGIDVDADLQWYTSLMLNRLMFVYFIQKKGFLDGDIDYLRNRLRLVQQRTGQDRFQTFYRYFLLRLFHDGLGKSADARKLASEMEHLLGKVPFLDGGFFEEHELERKYPGINIPDQAFQELFSFFDEYSWHLDERPLRADNEINPDVVGYIFEKYVNQKQMGAYYTREDITEYIATNTIIPFVFDAVRKECPRVFDHDGALWRHLRDEPDRYLNAPLRQGIVDSQGCVMPLPPDIEAGIRDVAKRGDWNAAATAACALPNETWRQFVARRQRCLDVREKLSMGEVHEINDLITLNLDIWQFARDAIINANSPELLRAFWHSIESVTVLDPTCGSGAFLFAALRILETLYADCLERMRRFAEDVTEGRHNQDQYSDFHRILAQTTIHANERYSVLKSIIVNNLFGVDIMDEAVEICKLRLFLKLVAQVDRVDQIRPLPDIDFNIRTGNSLVGYATADDVRRAFTEKKTVRGEVQARLVSSDAAEEYRRFAESVLIVDKSFRQFRAQQAGLGGKVRHTDKLELRRRLETLDDELDRFLANEYGFDVQTARCRDAWKASHQPFHWFAEFYGIMHAGGFDIVIGNPPYVSTGKVNYLSVSAKALKLPDLYAHILLRSLAVSHSRGRFGMIVPLSVTFSEDFGTLRKTLTSTGKAWFSSFDNIPAALFAGVSQRCTIWIGDRSQPDTFTTQVYRWRSITRPHLIKSIAYAHPTLSDVTTHGLPKIADRASAVLLSAIEMPFGATLRQVLSPSHARQHRIRFSQSSRNFVSAFMYDPPCLSATTLGVVPSSKIGEVTLARSEDVYASLSALVGELYFWYWLTRGDGFDVTSWIVSDFLKVLNHVPNHHFGLLVALGGIVHQRRFEALAFKKNAGKYVGNFNYRGHPWLTRRADLVLLAGLSAGRESALEVLDHVQRVLAINEFAGEKSIPDAVKCKFHPTRPDEIQEQRIFAGTDSLIREHFGFTKEQLEFLLYRDVAYRPGCGDDE